jgi:hsdS, type I site-specific deoxyribonuclease
MRCKSNPLYQINGYKEGIPYILFDLASWKNGLAFKDITFSTTGVPIIKIAELNNGIGITTAYTNQIFSDDVHLLKNDLLFSWSGNPETSIDIFRFKLEEGWLNQHIFKVIPNENIVNKDFFYFFMKYLKPYFVKIASNKQTIGLGHITVADLKRMSVILPNMKIQQAIAAVLNALDDKIEFNRRINTNLEQQAQAIFKEMFIQKKGKPVLLSDFCDFIKGKNPAVITSTYQTGAAFYLNIDSLTDIKQTYAIPKNFAMANVKDILMVMDGASSGTVYFGKEGIIGSTLAKIVVSDLSMQEVIYQTLKYFENDVRSHTTGSAIPHVDKQYILQLSVSLPDDYQLYSAYFETIRNMMIKNRTKNICLSTLRDTLLPKLMSGEIDVSKIEVD